MEVVEVVVVAGAVAGVVVVLLFVVVFGLELFVLSITETWACACISRRVKSSFCCLRAPLALEKKMTLL